MSEDIEFWREFANTYTEIFNSHDVERMFDYYADSAVLVFEPGVSVTKSEEMKAGIKQYFEELKPRLTADVRLAYQAGDLALMIVSYTLETTQDGVTTKKEGTATDIAVKSPDGKWRYAVDNHYGTELPG